MGTSSSSAEDRKAGSASYCYPFTEGAASPQGPSTNGPLQAPAPAPVKDLPQSARETELRALEKSKVISGYLSPADREKLANLLLVREYQKGDYIIKQGDAGAEFFILKKGVVEVWQETFDTAEQKKKNNMINRLNEGDCFGEQALISKVKRLASCVAASPCTVWVCSKDVFEKTFGSKRMFATRVAVSAETTKQDAKGHGVHNAAARDTKKDERIIKLIMDATEKNILFADLTREQKRAVAGEMWKVNCPKGHKIIEQGKINDDVFYVVDSGKFDISINGQRVAERGGGQCFGELALLYNQPRAATVTAREDAILWAVDRFTFREKVAESNKKTLDVYEQLLKKLDGVPLLKALNDEERRKVGEAIEEVSKPAGTVLMSQGEKPPVDGSFYMYFLIEGKCYCKIVKPDGSLAFEKNYEPGSYFGELALMHNEPRKATITCTTDCLLYALSGENFRELIGTVGGLAGQLEHTRTSVYNLPPGAGGANGASSPRLSDSKAGAPPKQPTQGGSSMSQPVYKTAEDDEPPIQQSDLDVKRVLGKGSFGTVKLVVHKKTKKTYALKSVWKKQIVETGQQGHIMSEKKVMTTLRHPFLIRLYNTYKDHDRLYFLLELSLGGELFTVLRARQAFDEPTARFYAATVVLAFEYMHSKDMIYRDLKPENLLLDSQGFLKVTDFGFAKEIPNGRTWTLCGTPDYLAPEIVAGKGHGKGVDWWTLGIFLFEMLASYPPFYDEDPMKTYSKIMAGKINYPAHFSKDATNLISRLLEHKPTKRLGVVKGGADNIKAHPFFKGFDWNKLFHRQMTPPIQQPVTSPEDTQNFDDYPNDDGDVKANAYNDDGTAWDKDF